MSLVCAPFDLATSKSFASFTSTLQHTITDYDNPTNFVWNEVVASTSEDWAGVYYTCSTSSSIGGLMHLAVGAAGSEIIVAYMPARITKDTAQTILAPVFIPAGSRISIASDQSTGGNSQIKGLPAAENPNMVSYPIYETGPFQLSHVENLSGVTLDPGGVANTKTPWIELTHGQVGSDSQNWLDGASLSRVYEYLGFSFSCESGNQGPMNWLIDLGYGPAGMETVVVENYHVQAESYDRCTINPVWIPWNKPIGTRVAARVQSDGIGTSNLIQGFLLHGVR